MTNGRMKRVSVNISVSGNLVSVQADREGAFHVYRRAGYSQRCRADPIGRKVIGSKLGNHSRHVSLCRAKARSKFTRTQKLVKPRISRRVKGRHQTLRLVDGTEREDECYGDKG